MANEIEIRVTSANASRGGFRDVERDAQRMGQAVRRDVSRAMGDMVSETQRAAQQTGQAMGEAFDGMADDARDGARQAGRALNRTMDAAFQEIERDARRTGEEVGESVGQGAEESGGGRMRKAGGKMAGALKAAPWAAAGAAIGAVVVDSIHTAMENEDATAVLKAQIGGFAGEGEKAAKAAGHVFRQAYGESLEEVNEAVGAVVTSIRGMRTANSSAVEDMTIKAMNLAKAFGVEVARSVQVVGQLVKTNLVKDADEGMDLLTASLQRVPAAVREDLVDALDEYGPFMEQIGIKGERAFNILVAAADKGMFGLDKTGDAFKELTLKIASDAPAVDDALKSIGLTQAGLQDAFAKGGVEGRDAFNKIVKGLLAIKDPGDRAAQAIALFGTPIEDLNTKDIPAFLRSLTNTKDVLGQTSGAAEKMGDTLNDTASNRLTAFTRTLKGELVDVLGGPILGGLEEFADKGGGVFDDWLADHEEVTESAKEMWKDLQELFDEVFSNLEEWVNENRDTLDEWGDDLAEIFEEVSDTISTSLDIATELWEKFGPTVLEFVTVFIDTLIDYWKGLFKTLKGVYDVFAGLLSGDWEQLWEGLKEIASGLGEALWAIIKGLLGLIVVTFKGTWRLIGGVVEGGFDDIRDTASEALDWIVGKIKSFGRHAEGAFHSAVGGIKKVWHEIEGATRDPVKYVVEAVYNKGIRPVWNLVAGIAGMGKLDRMKFRDGGLVDARAGGIAPGWSANDNRIGLFRDGEGVLVPEVVQSLGPNLVLSLNRAGRRARDVLLGGDPSSSGMIRGFKDGGIVGKIGHIVNSGANWMKGLPGMVVDKGITAWAHHLLDPIMKQSAGGSGWWGQAVRTMPGTMIGQFIGWVKSNLENLLGGGGDFGRALSWARTQDGKGYQWGGNGNPSWDCSGFQSAIESVIRGEPPHRRWATMAFQGGAPSGWHQNMGSNFRIGVTHAGVGHTAGTLMGVNVESSGSGGVRVGGGARGADDGMFPYHYGFRKADNGTRLRPGPNVLYNATGTLEELRPVDQIPEVHVHITVDNHGVIGSRIDLEDWLTRALDSLRRQGRLADLVTEARAR